MKCPFCAHLDSKVIDSRLSEDGVTIRRRRECSECQKRYTTYEKIESTPVLVIKSDGTRQVFDVSKIKKGLLRACEKRPVTASDIDKLLHEVEKQVQNSLAQEVSSKKIGEMVMELLKDLDQVSFVRFASVHREFQDIQTLKEEIDRLMSGTKSNKN